MELTQLIEDAGKSQGILEELNDAQKEVVLGYEGFSVVSAGPGAGKTKTLVSRAAYMIEQGIPSSNMLLFTFTKKAANEIKERVEKKIGDKAFGITVSTYHSFCARQLRKYCHYLGYTDNFSIIDADQQIAVVAGILAKMGSTSKPNDLLSAISSYKDKHWTPRQAAAHVGDDPATEESLIVYEKYQKKLKANNAMDFDDLLFNMTTILEKFDVVRQKMWARYKYITAKPSLAAITVM